MKIGRHIQRFRKTRKMSLRELAAETQLSPSSLSNIERDINSPTLNSLNTICQALDIHLIDLLQAGDDKEAEGNIIRKEHRRAYCPSENNEITYELLALPDRDLKLLQVTMQPGCDFGYVSQSVSSDEIGLVLEGEMDVQINGGLVHLKQGDCIYLDRGSVYKYRNPGTEKCVSIWGMRGELPMIPA